MSQQVQVTRWEFESEHSNLIVYSQAGEKLAHFAGGKFGTKDREVAVVLRGFDAYCREVATARMPIVIHNTEDGEPDHPPQGRPSSGRAKPTAQK